MPIPNAWEKEAEWERPLAETKWAESRSISMATRAHCGERWVLGEGAHRFVQHSKEAREGLASDGPSWQKA